MEFQWAEQYPDLLETILQFNLTELSEATNAKYSFQQPLIQNGPQCGLIALAMASACPTNEYVEKIFAKAQQLGYTNKGEIFSCQYMWNLAKEFLDKETKLYEGSLANDSIITFLLADGMLLVPYDADKNHGPCNLQGHKAHWGLVVGVVETHEETYVIARQGKSKHLKFWPLQQLAASNSQLNEVSPTDADSNLYVLPDGGIGGSLGLANKCVLIYSNNNVKT